MTTLISWTIVPFVVIVGFLIWFTYLDIKEGRNQFENSQFSTWEIIFGVFVFIVIVALNWGTSIVPLFPLWFQPYSYVIPVIAAILAVFAYRMYKRRR